MHRTLICLMTLLAALSSPAAAQFEIPAGWPDAATTGIAGAGLTLDDLVDRTGEGTIRVTQPGTVVEGAKIWKLRIQADGVTVRNCWFTNGDPYPIDNAEDHAGLLVEDCTFVGAGTSCAIVGRYTMRRCDISGFQDGVKIKSGCILEDCYIHDLYKAEGTHNDCIQKQNGNSLVDAQVLHNTLMGPYQTSTSAIICGPSEGETLDGFFIHDNYVFGGAFAMQIRNSGGAGPFNVSLKNNVFADGSWQFGPLILDGSGHTLVANVDQYGQSMSFNQSCAPAATPTIVPAGGEFVGPTEVVMACATPGAVIRYELDHGDVTESSPLYTAAITLTGNTRVRARAFAEGLDPSMLAVAILKVDVNQPPVARAGDDIVAVDLGDDGLEPVALDASASTDLDGTIVGYSWRLHGVEIASGVTAEALLPVGTHTLTLAATDNEGGVGRDTLAVTVHPRGRRHVVYASPRDNEVRGDGTFRGEAETKLRVGGGQSGADSAAVFPFALPALAAGERLVAADLAIRLDYIANNPAGHVDLYGLGRRASAAVLAGDFYQGPFGGDATDAWPLVDDFATFASKGLLSTDAAGDAALLAYLNDQCAGGAAGGEWAFFRLNPDIADVGNFLYWVFKSANNDASVQPRLTILSSIPTPGDADGDGHVNIADFILLKQNYGAAAGATAAQGDFNGDGAVNIEDFIILKQNYGS